VSLLRTAGRRVAGTWADFKLTPDRRGRSALGPPCSREGPVAQWSMQGRQPARLFGIVKRIVNAQAQFRSLAEPWADTGTRTGRLMLALLGGLADVERDLIRTRTAEGRTRAKAQGKPMGRPPRLTAAQKAEARRRRAEGATLNELARSYDVSRSTISRLTAGLD
jgi:DNA invertase Pin-like site-specific DNA recombinase